LRPNMAWVWDYIPHYHLSEEDVQGYLRNLFGNYNFYLSVRHPCGKGSRVATIADLTIARE